MIKTKIVKIIAFTFCWAKFWLDRVMMLFGYAIFLFINKNIVHWQLVCRMFPCHHNLRGCADKLFLDEGRTAKSLGWNNYERIERGMKEDGKDN